MDRDKLILMLYHLSESLNESDRMQAATKSILCGLCGSLAAHSEELLCSHVADFARVEMARIVERGSDPLNADIIG